MGPVDYGSGMWGIDSLMHTVPGVTSVYLLQATRPVLIEAAPATSLEHVLDGLQTLGVGAHDLATIVLTHVHLDHGGAAGHLARLFPKARVAVHVEGAHHIADPSRLLTSASRLYPDMSIWGDMLPVERDRILAVEDNDIIEVQAGRSLKCIYTPGHAKHHMCVFDSLTGDLFTGDGIGIKLQEASIIRPAIVPPEFDPQKTLASIDLMRALGANRIVPTHFGPASMQPGKPVSHLLDQAQDALKSWLDAGRASFSQDAGTDHLLQALTAHAQATESSQSRQAREKLDVAMPLPIAAAGIERYLHPRPK